MRQVEINQANGGVAINALDDTNGVVWISGYDLFILNNTQLIINGTIAGDVIPEDTAGTPLEFGLALTAANNIGTSANPIYATATLKNGRYIPDTIDNTPAKNRYVYSEYVSLSIFFRI